MRETERLDLIEETGVEARDIIFYFLGCNICRAGGCSKYSMCRQYYTALNAVERAVLQNHIEEKGLIEQAIADELYLC